MRSSTSKAWYKGKERVGLREKGLYSPAVAMTAAGSLLGSGGGLLAARRLCAIITRKRAGEGGQEAAQARREREGSLAALP